MKLIRKIALLSCLACFLYSCSTNKESYLKDFEKFIDKTEKNVKEFSETEWEKAQAEFKEYSETWFEQFKEELTADEKIKVGMLKGKFSSATLKYEAGKLMKQLNN